MSLSAGADSSNNALPAASPVVISVPPVPSPSRGERCVLDGQGGRLHSDKQLLAYHSGKSVVVRNLQQEGSIINGTTTDNTAESLNTLVYRGHSTSPVSAVKISPSGAYIASGDERGVVRVWALDHVEHLCKYTGPAVTGVVRDLQWDDENKRIAICGERAPGDARSDCARVWQWDTGVSVGQLCAHLKGRVASIAFKPNRPYRIVTAGKDDTKLYFHKGPPFGKIPSQDNVPCESAHSKGAVTCVRYNKDGSLVVSVGSDRSVCLYDGKTLEFLQKLENVHTATIYAVAWSSNCDYILTASGDGTCKLISVGSDNKLQEKRTYNVAANQTSSGSFDKVPVGGVQLGCTFCQGDQPVSVGFNGQLSLLPSIDSADDKIKVITGHYAPIDGMAVDYKQNVFYTGDTDGILCKWDLKTCQPISRLQGKEGNDDLLYIVHTGAISGLAVAKNGSLLSIGWDDKLNISDNKAEFNKTDPIALGAQPNAIAAGGKLAVIATVQGLLLVDSASGKLVSSDFIKLGYTAQAVCMTKDDSIVYVGGDDCKIYVYKVKGGDSLEQVHVIENGHLKPLHSLALSHDESKLAAGDDRDVCVWSTTDYKAVVVRGRWCFHVQRVTCLAWSLDDTVIASGGADDSIYLWNLKKLSKRIHYPYAHRGGLTGINFCSGNKFISVGMDAVVNMWDPSKDIEEKFK